MTKIKQTEHGVVLSSNATGAVVLLKDASLAIDEWGRVTITLPERDQFARREVSVEL